MPEADGGAEVEDASAVDEEVVGGDQQRLLVSKLDQEPNRWTAGRMKQRPLALVAKPAGTPTCAPASKATIAEAAVTKAVVVKRAPARPRKLFLAAAAERVIGSKEVARLAVPASC